MRRMLMLAATIVAGAQVLPATAQEPWRLAAIAPITGASAGYAAEYKLGYEIAAEEINRKGGIKGRPVTLSIADSQSNPAQVAALIRQACNDAVVVVGPTGSFESQVAFPVANSMQCPSFASATAAHGLTAANRPWAFSIVTPSSVTTPLVIQTMMSVAKPKKAVVIIEKADPSALQYAEASVKSLQGSGVQVESLTVANNDVDFGPVLSRVAAAAPDLVVISTLDRAAIGVLKEIRKSRLKATMLLTQATYSALVEQQPPEMLEGVYRFAQADLATSADPRAKEFIKAYQAKTGGRSPTFLAAFPYDVVMVTKEVIESAGLQGDARSRADDRKKFIDKLNTVKDYQGLTGKMTMTPEGYMLSPPTVLVYRGNKWERVN